MERVIRTDAFFFTWAAQGGKGAPQSHPPVNSEGTVTVEHSVAHMHTHGHTSGCRLQCQGTLTMMHGFCDTTTLFWSDVS